MTRSAAAGVRYLNPHQCRHTYGHWLREEDFDIEERQVAMGHESIRTTQFYYGRLTSEDVAAKIAGLRLTLVIGSCVGRAVTTGRSSPTSSTPATRPPRTHKRRR